MKLTFDMQADVYDHIDFALTSLDMFSDISENLINYAFNVSFYPLVSSWGLWDWQMASYELNNGMCVLMLFCMRFLFLNAA